MYRAPKDRPHVHASAHGAESAEQEPPGPRETPVWKAPAGWTEKEGSQMSVATFAIASNGGQTVEASIMPFPRKVPELTLINVWRQQLNLPVLDQAVLDRRTEEVSIGDQTGRLFDVGGSETEEEKQKRDKFLIAVLPRNGVTWFFKLQGESAAVLAQKSGFIDFLKTMEFQAAAAAPEPPAPAVAGNVTATGASKALPAWEAPANWQASPPGDVLLAKFAASGGGGARTEITVSSFPGSVGGVLGNVNRWRGQLSLTPLAPADLAKAVETIDLPAGQATLVDITGTDPSTQKPARMVAAIVPRGGATWFYKMLGDVQVTEQEKPAFLKFLQSLRYPNG